MSRRIILTAAAVLALTAIAIASPAKADDPQYTTVAWAIDNPASIWETPQHDPVSVTGPAVDFAGVEALVNCGRYYQLDGNHAGDIINSTIAGGLLYGPNNPGEDLAYNAPGTEVTDGTPWMYFSAPDCTETVCVDSFTQSTTTYRWTWDGAAVVRTDTATTAATLSEADAIAAGCYVPPVVVDPTPPTLALTGTETLWLLPLSVLFLMVGGLLLTKTVSRRKGI